MPKNKQMVNMTTRINVFIIHHQDITVSDDLMWTFIVLQEALTVGIDITFHVVVIIREVTRTRKKIHIQLMFETI